MTSSRRWDLSIHKILRDEIQKGLTKSLDTIDPEHYKKTQECLNTISFNIKRAEALLSTQGLTDFSEFDRLMKDNITLFDKGSDDEN